MRKFVLFFAFLFLTAGVMAQVHDDSCSCIQNISADEVLSGGNAVAVRDTSAMLQVKAAELRASVAEAEVLLGRMRIGDGIGMYSAPYSGYKEDFLAIKSFADSIPVTATVEDVQIRTE